MWEVGGDLAKQNQPLDNSIQFPGLARGYLEHKYTSKLPIRNKGPNLSEASGG